MNDTPKSLLVISGHAADFVWRCGGAIAVHTKLHGYRAVVVCLSLGERGESGAAWKAPGATPESVRELRRAESRAAAEVLGCDIQYMDAPDYLMRPTPEMLDWLIALYREVQPRFVLTHAETEVTNFDHQETYRLALQARMVAQVPGHPGGQPIGAPQVYSYEPHQSEMTSFKPNTLLDITEVWDVKKQAMHCVPTQSEMWEYYERIAQQRGGWAGRRTGAGPVAYAEAFQRIFPALVAEL